MFEINKHLVLSTGHIEEAASTALAACRLWTVATYECGYFLSIPDLGDPLGLEECLQQSDLPRSVHGLIRIAYIQGCTWLQLDADGPTVKALPLYDW